MNYFRERVLEPILIPLVALFLIGFGALNLSRLFLASSHADRSVLVATGVSVAILAGAAWATSRERIDRGVLLGGGAMLGVVLAGAGLLAQQVDLDREKEAHGAEGGEVAAASEVVVPTEDTNFPEKEFSAAPGAIKFTYQVGAGSHTLVVEGFEGEFKLGPVSGETVSGVFELEAGEYVLYCDIPGHREVGMEGTLTVAEGAGEAPAGGTEAAEEGAAEEGATGGGAAAGGGVPITVTAVDIDFPETEFSAQVGTVSFEYVNEGAAPHTLVVEGFESDMKIDLAGGEKGTGSIELEAGEYVLYCDVPGHRAAGMEAKLAVT